MRCVNYTGMILLAAALAVCGPARAQDAYSGASGYGLPSVAAEMPPGAPILVPAVEPVDLPLQQAVPLPPPDPCAAYAGAYQTYVFCQDRIKKLERMQTAKKDRAKPDEPAPVAAPASAPVQAQPQVIRNGAAVMFAPAPVIVPVQQPAAPESSAVAAPVPVQNGAGVTP